ncbi:hypothetical protein CPLU01_15144 [Colletotrichum plurivorum]|uniref:Fucose-specific lectin n=1 Tax=Colletotrichum plurivorum TaxID=2175906 RepID=A0A8H6MW43_9PEZI|nr:hypothetical protein CPLU01_15144 [Colletotrichum plurivorum]
MTTPNYQASSRPEYYGGLEVDTRQPNNGGWNADDFSKFRMTDQPNPSNLPEVQQPYHDYPEVSPHQGHGDYSLPQALHGGAAAGTAAAAAPTAPYDGSYYAPTKESSGSGPEVVAKEIKDKRGGTICGLRRKMFWIVLAIALVVIIAGVGGGVGGAMAANNSQTSDSSSDGSSGSSSGGGSGSGTGSGDGSSDSGSGSGGSSDSGDSNSNSTSAIGILNTSNIGSLNFTDQYGFENHMVFYQRSDKVLMQSSWNSSGTTWQSAVANKNSDIKEGTPISNSLFYHSNTTRDIRIYYLNDKNQVMGQVNGNPIYGFSWDKSGVSETYTADASSQMLSNGIYTKDSYLSNLVFYQDTAGTITVLRRTGGNTDWVATGITTNFDKPAMGTGLSLIPIYTTDLVKKMKLFYASDAGSLISLELMNNNDWSNETLPTTVEKTASITAFSSGYNNTDLTIHVLATQSKGPPVLTSWSGGEWKNEGVVESMSGDDRPIKIAANLGGRVYGIVERNESKVEIVEWEWMGGTTYNKLGVVNVVV